jgi:hypothetical protein
MNVTSVPLIQNAMCEIIETMNQTERKFKSRNSYVNISKKIGQSILNACATVAYQQYQNEKKLNKITENKDKTKIHTTEKKRNRPVNSKNLYSTFVNRKFLMTSKDVFDLGDIVLKVLIEKEILFVVQHDPSYDTKGHNYKLKRSKKLLKIKQKTITTISEPFSIKNDPTIVIFNPKLELFKKGNIFAKLNALPMLCEPNPWVKTKDVQGFQHVIGGGYLLNAQNDYNKFVSSSYSKSNDDDSSVDNKSLAESLRIEFTTQAINNVNYLMKIPYKINKQFFIYAISNFLIFLDQQGYTIHRLRDHKKSPDLKQYAKELREIQKIIRKFVIADLLLDKIFYIPLISDFRGRLYSSSILSYQSDELGRSLICMISDNETNKSVRLDACGSAMQVLGAITGDPSNLLNETHVWGPKPEVEDIYVHFVNSLNTEMKFQINLLLSNPEIAKSLITLESKSDLLFNEKLEISKIQSSVNNFLINEKNELFINRKFAKGIAMKQSYNQGRNGMLLGLRTDYMKFPVSLEPILNSKYILDLKEKLKNTEIKNGKNVRLFNTEIRIKRKEIKAKIKKAENPFRTVSGYRGANLIVSSFYKIMRDEFSFILNAQKVTQKVSSLNEGPTVFGVGSPLSVSQYYVKTINYKPRPSKGRDFNVNLQVQMSPIKVDKAKSMVSTMANTVHNLDAFILNHVVKRCSKNKYFVSTCHDCFIVDSKNEQAVKGYYLEGIKILIKSNPLLKLVSDNQTISKFEKQIENSRIGTKKHAKLVHDLEEFKKLLEKIDKDVQNLIPKLDTKTPSDKILSDESEKKFLKVGFLDEFKKRQLELKIKKHSDKILSNDYDKKVGFSED